MQGTANERAVALIALAERAAAERRWPEAIEAYRQVLQLRPGDPATLVQLSYVHSLAGQYQLARGFALQAQRAGSRDPTVLDELLPRLRTFNEGPALIAAIEQARPMSRMPIPLLLTAAAQLSYLNLPERAIGFLDEARRADPDYPPTLLARTQVLTYLGRFDEARLDIERVLQRAPQIAQAYWVRSALPGDDARNRHADQIRRQLAQPGLRADDFALLGYALHRELDCLGDVSGAWQALELACRAKRSALTYSTQDTMSLFKALTDLAADVRKSHEDATDDEKTGQPTPIFIVGMHRSGTTLLEQLLAGHEAIEGSGELYDFTSAMRYVTDHHCRGVLDATIVERARQVNLTEAGVRYLASVAWRLDGRRCFTDKLPSNFMNIGFICQALPQARIVHMVRDPVETCFSNLRELFSDANPYSYDQLELADFHGEYRKLMRTWHARFPGRILDVDYAWLTTDTEAELRKVIDFCGLAFEPAMLRIEERRRGVVTASAVQVRGGVQARQVAKWSPYAGYLQPMIQRLSEQA